MPDHPKPKGLTSKPGAACVGCKQRKLRCTRDQEGCSNCLKADLPCVYPSPEPPKKRGPYKKDKPARERHLEDVLRYLEPHTKTQAGSISGVQTLGDASHLIPMEGRSEITEHLVKDALNALTSAGGAERDDHSSPVATDSTKPSAVSLGLTELPIAVSVSPLEWTSLHPMPEQVFGLWQTFMSRVDPLTKIIHCPSVGAKVIMAVKNPVSMKGKSFETLMFAIYFCAIAASHPHELHAYACEDQQKLLWSYGQAIENALTDAHEAPCMETLQALMLYIVGCRRRDFGTNHRTLFSLAVRSARTLNIDKKPRGVRYSPFEVEMRRRIWWQLCALESLGAEEGGARSSSIAEGCKIDLPSNLNDVDLDPQSPVTPKAREGITDMTFVLSRFSNVQLVFRLRMIRKTCVDDGDTPITTARLEQNRLYESHQTFLAKHFYDYMDDTRPYDWLCRNLSHTMLLKARMLIDHPFGSGLAINMSDSERLQLLQNSVDIIRATQLLETDERIKQWRWLWRGYVQWHAIAIVVTELSHSKNPQFIKDAWVVLDQALQGWNEMYRNKRGEPAWDHVNTLIERAKQMKVLKEQVSLVSTIGTRREVIETSAPLVRSSKDQGQYGVGPRDGQVDYGNPAIDVDTIMEPGFSGMSWVDDMNDMLHDIDFSAFGAVFADEAWEFPRADDNIP